VILMARSGPTTIDSTTIPIGLAQVRVIASAGNIGQRNPVSTSADSLGAMASTKFVGEVDWYDFESGFPLQTDASWAIREKAKMECGLQEVTPKNLAFAYGIDATTGYSAAHSGEVVLGNRSAPSYVRMEAMYTYPDGTNRMWIIFPRAQCKAAVEMDFQKEEASVTPISFEATNADSSVTGGNAVWNNRALGRIFWSAAFS
jgi:hypothetical protein